MPFIFRGESDEIYPSTDNTFTLVTCIPTSPRHCRSNTYRAWVKGSVWRTWRSLPFSFDPRSSRHFPEDWNPPNNHALRIHRKSTRKPIATFSKVSKSLNVPSTIPFTSFRRSSSKSSAMRASVSSEGHDQVPCRPQAISCTRERTTSQRSNRRVGLD